MLRQPDPADEDTTVRRGRRPRARSSPATAASDEGGPVGPHGSCNVTKAGTAGVLVTGRLLLPTEPLDGEVLIDGTGNIVCVAASCATAPAYVDDAAKYKAAYDAATQVTCRTR